MDKEALDRVTSELRAYGAVAVLGAGVSYLSGYPLAGDLQALVWHAIESDPAALAAVANELGVPARSAKAMIGDREEAIAVAFQVMERQAPARSAFQAGFASLDAQRRPHAGPSHDALARLLHARVVDRAISLNWDTATQFAHLCRYGRFLDIASGQFDKPHGDASDPGSPWVLPHQHGAISSALRAELDGMVQDRPRVLLVIGYSERDEAVVTQLIDPLEDRWRVVRIGPSVGGSWAVRGLADDVLPALALRLVAEPELPGWEYVGFEGQRDLGAALLGESLGPRDVESCPALPEVDEVIQRLRLAGVVVLQGESGSGKSITLYQGAHVFHNEGWEVVRLRDYRDPESSVVSLRRVKHRTLAIVDNAQALPEDIVDRMMSSTGPDVMILIALTEGAPVAHARIEIARGRAVGILAEAMQADRAAVLALVHQLDRRVADDYFGEPLERRIAAAAASDYPWQFSFVLTGGELRAQHHLAELRDHDRADMLLAALAVGQLLTLDTGVDRAWLDEFATMYGRTKVWLDLALVEIRSRRLLLERPTLRLPHLRYAAMVLRDVCDRHLDPALSGFASGLQWALGRDDASLRGISWLLSELGLSLAFRRQDQQLIGDQTIERLLARSWASTTQFDRSMACFVINGLLPAGPLALESVRQHRATLSQWLEGMEAAGAPGMARLLNDVGRQDHSLTEAICDAVDAARLGGRLSETTLDDAYAWGNLLGRLGYAASREWIDSLAAALDLRKLTSTASAFDVDHLADFNELVKGMWSVAPEYLDLVEAALEALGACFNRAPAEATARSHDIVWFALGYAPDFLRRDEPSQRQSKLAESLASRLDAGAIARAVSEGSVRIWHELHPLLAFLSEVDPPLLRRSADSLDMEALDRATRELWETMPKELVVILMLIAERTDPSAGAQLVQQHADRLEQLDPILASLNPEAVARGVRRGLPLPLRRDPDHSWVDGTSALQRLYETDHEAARQVLASNRVSIERGLRLPNAESCDGLEAFIAEVDAIQPGYVDQLLTAIGGEASGSWNARLAGSDEEQQAAQFLLARSETLGATD